MLYTEEKETVMLEPQKLESIQLHMLYEIYTMVNILVWCHTVVVIC